MTIGKLSIYDAEITSFCVKSLYTKRGVFLLCK